MKLKNILHILEPYEIHTRPTGSMYVDVNRYRISIDITDNGNAVISYMLINDWTFGAHRIATLKELKRMTKGND